MISTWFSKYNLKTFYENMFEDFKDMCFKFHFKNLVTKVELSLFKP